MKSRLIFRKRKKNAENTLTIRVTHIGHKQDIPRHHIDALTNIAGTTMLEMREQGVGINSITITCTYEHDDRTKS